MNKNLQFPKVAITGGAGYVGSVLVPLLLRNGYEVKVIDLFWYGEHVFNQVKGPLTIVKADIRDYQTLESELKGMDSIIHLACISNDPSFALDPELGKSINYDAFLGLFKAAKAARIRRFIYASSSSVYGVRNEPDVRENSPTEPLTDYSRYKLLCEQALIASDLPEKVILRPATACGYAPRLRLDLTVNILTIHALVRKKITVFGGEQLRPHIHVLDMADVYKLLLEAPAEKVHGKIFNAGYENRSVAETAELVRDAVGGAKVSIETQPSDDLRSYHINSNLIRDVLGYSPCRTISDAVVSLCQSYRAGRIPDPFTNPCYYNIKMMQQIKP